MHREPTGSGRTVSVWMDRRPFPDAPPLTADTDADVCVIGAGIAGLSVACTLAAAGVRVVVIDDGPIGGGETSRTTAHLTWALDDRFYELERMLGRDRARLALESHAAAIERIEATVEREMIDCGFARLDGYLFVPDSLADRREDFLRLEEDAVRRCGGTVERLEAVPLPLPGADTGPCLRLPGQAQFDALAYLDGLARALLRRGGRIFTGAHADEIHGGKDARVVAQTDAGRFTVTCRDVVVATNAPVNDRVRIHTKQAPYRTYVVALRIPRASVPPMLLWDGYWDDADFYHYVRLLDGPADAGDAASGGGDDLLIVGGEDHKVGQAEDSAQRYAKLEAWARRYFPAAGEVTHRWSGQVVEPADGMGLIGRNPLDYDNVYVVTGDSGNGMTHGTIAGILIPDLILGRENPWTELYDPGRVLPMRAAGEFARENLNVAVQYADWVRPGEADALDEIPAGEGVVIRRGLRKLAVYKDPSGRCHEMSATCTHLGCVVRWNNGEKSWDCPCHGSRFDPTGRVLNGPANKPLEPVTHSAPEQDATPGRASDAADDTTPRAGPRPGDTEARHDLQPERTERQPFSERQHRGEAPEGRPGQPSQ